MLPPPMPGSEPVLAMVAMVATARLAILVATKLTTSVQRLEMAGWTMERLKLATLAMELEV